MRDLRWRKITSADRGFRSLRTSIRRTPASLDTTSHRGKFRRWNHPRCPSKLSDAVRNQIPISAVEGFVKAGSNFSTLNPIKQLPWPRTQWSPGAVFWRVLGATEPEGQGARTRYSLLFSCGHEPSSPTFFQPVALSWPDGHGIPVTTQSADASGRL
jgi:hypothetical protein